MTGYIYINFNDLSPDKQEEIEDMAREELREETTNEEAEGLNMELEDLIDERVGGRLLKWSNQGKFVFNI